MSLQLLTTAEAADKLGVSVRTVQRMIEDGRLRAERVGHDYMIRPEALERVKTETGTGRGGSKMKLDYWTAFGRLLALRARLPRLPKPRPESWMAFGVGGNCRVAAHIRPNEGKVGVDLTLGRGAKEFYAELEREREDIEKEIGMKLDWEPRPNGVESWVLVRRDADPTDRLDWSAQHYWLGETLEAFHRAFEPRIRRLQSAA